jgi:MFS family permease
MAGRVFQGIGYGVAFTSSLGYISMWLEGSSRQKCITIQATSIAIGQMVFSVLSVPWFNVLGSWQAVMGIDCVLGLIAAVLWSIFASNRVRSDDAQNNAQAQVVKENPLRAAFKSRAAIGLLIVIFGIMYTYNVFTSYGPTFFQTVRGLSPEMAGVMIGLLPLAGILGVIIGGFLTTKFGTRKWVLVAVCIVMFVSGICALVFALPILMVVAMLLLGCSNQLKNPAGQSIGMDIPGSTPAFASAVIGLSYGIPQIFTFLIPYLVGGLNNAMGLQATLMILCVPLLISLIGALFVLPETGPRAKKKLEKKAAEVAE